MVEGVRTSGYTQWRRGGRVVECGGLENRYVGNPGVGGSNPPLSASGASRPVSEGEWFGTSWRSAPRGRAAKRWPGKG